MLFSIENINQFSITNMQTFIFLLISSAFSKIAYINRTSSMSKSSGFKQISSENSYLITLETQDEFNFYVNYQPVQGTSITYNFSQVFSDYPTLSLSPSSLFSNGKFLQWQKMAINIHKNYNPKLIQGLDLSSLSAGKTTGTVLGACFGPISNTDIYALISQKQVQMWIFSNSLTVTSKTLIPSLLVSDTVDKMICRQGKIFITTLRNLVILAHSPSLDNLWQYQYPPVGSVMDMDISVNGKILAISYNYNLEVYDHTAPKTPKLLQSFTQTLSISSVAVVNTCYIITQNTAKLTQYDYQIGQMIYQTNSQTKSKKKINIIDTNKVILSEELYVSGLTSTNGYEYYQVDQAYDCTSKCQACFNTYSFDPVITTLCVKNNVSSPIIPAVQNTYNHCFIFGQNQICSIFCDYKCNFCADDRQNCISCSNQRYMNDQNQCVTPPSTALYTFMINIGSTFRFGPTQGIFFFIDNFEKYQYHKTEYTGTFKAFLDEVNRISDLKWSLIPVDLLLDWTKRPSDKYISYNSFTNARFLQVDQVCALLTSSTNIFYLLFMPLVFVIFLGLKFLFKLLFKYKISIQLRMYSFWLQYFVIIFLSNSVDICFYSLQHIQLLFSLTTDLKYIHAVSITFIGFFVIVLLSIFMMSLYLYGNLSKYFLNNLYRTRWAFIYSFLIYSVRPMIQATLHVILYQNAKYQLMLLAILYALFILLGMILQIKADFFKIKTMFFCEIAIGTCMIMLNILLYFKQIFLEDDQQLFQAAQHAIQTYIYSICYSIAYLSIFAAVFVPIACVVSEAIPFNKQKCTQHKKSVKICQKQLKIPHLQTIEHSKFNISIRMTENFDYQISKVQSIKFTQITKNHPLKVNKFKEQAQSLQNQPSQTEVNPIANPTNKKTKLNQSNETERDLNQSNIFEPISIKNQFTVKN